jgi:hypothetical protein
MEGGCTWGGGHVGAISLAHMGEISSQAVLTGSPDEERCADWIGLTLG